LFSGVLPELKGKKGRLGATSLLEMWSLFGSDPAPWAIPLQSRFRAPTGPNPSRVIATDGVSMPLFHALSEIRTEDRHASRD
jgi:hypothetical protein